MERNIKIGDFVVSDDVEGEVIEILDLAGDLYLKLSTPRGDRIVSCEDARLCERGV